MNIIKYCTIVLLTLLLATGCNREKEQYLSDWKALVTRIETKEKLTDAQLDTINIEYERLNNKYSEINNDLNADERLEIQDYQSRYAKAYEYQTQNDVISGLQGILETTESIVKSFVGEDGSKELSKILSSIDTSEIKNITKLLNNKDLKKIISKTDDADIKDIASGMASLGAILSGSNLNEKDINTIKENITEEDINKLKNSITKEDIEALKKSITAEDIKKLKKSLSAEEIARLKEIYKELNTK